MTAAASCTTGTTDQGIITLQSGRGTIRNCQLPALITDTLSLTARRADGIMYSINGRVDVGVDTRLVGGDDGILNIAPGVTVFGRTTSSVLVVNRGSDINADGLANLPIIFTSLSNLDSVVNPAAVNQWGGIIINGHAPVSECNTAVSPGGQTTGGNADCWRRAEGLTVDRLFGGDQPADDSGVIRYVQVNFTGQGQNGDEIQGITTGGLGTGTEMDHIQIHNSSDDGIEIFGGTNNLERLVITGAADDTLDTDFGYIGAIQFVLGIRRDDNYPGDAVGARTMLEVDTGGLGNSSPRQYLKLANFTFLQNSAEDPAIRIRGGADVDLINGIVIATQPDTAGDDGCFDIDDAETAQGAGTFGGTPDNGPVRLLSVVFQCTVLANDDADTFENTVLTNPANSNVVTNFTNTLLFLTGSSSGYRFANGGNETGVTAASNLTSISAFFDQVSYIGAFSGPNDDWTAGWTCNSDIADLHGATNCTEIRIS